MSASARSPQVVVWAPGHDLLDRRVNRVLEVLAALGAHTTAVYDGAHAGRTIEEKSPATAVRLLAGDKRGTVAAILGMRKWLASIESPVDLLYIHDSGLFGLLLALQAARHRRGIRIVFDYHDWIPWEIWYQWYKLVRQPALARRLAGFTQRVVLPWLGGTAAFRGVVGISPGQLEGLRELVPAVAGVPGIAIPNTRRRLPDPRVEETGGPLTLLWIGNIMEGRDLDRLLSYAEALRRDVPSFAFSVLIIGKVLSAAMLARLQAGPYVRHVPGFSSDENLRELVAGTRAVGVFLGWDDVAGTDINRIASPNKVYSYVNIGVPVIYARSLETVGEVIPAPAGAPINDGAEFREAVLAMDNNYPARAQAVRALRPRIMWDDGAQASLTSFLARQLRCDASQPAS